MTEATVTAIAFLEGNNGFEFRAYNGHEDHLGNALAGLDSK